MQTATGRFNGRKACPIRKVDFGNNLVGFPVVGLLGSSEASTSDGTVRLAVFDHFSKNDFVGSFGFGFFDRLDLTTATIFLVSVVLFGVRFFLATVRLLFSVVWIFILGRFFNLHFFFIFNFDLDTLIVVRELELNLAFQFNVCVSSGGLAFKLDLVISSSGCDERKLLIVNNGMMR